MAAQLYTVYLSHPAESVRLMLEHKGIEHEVVHLMPGFHPQLLRLRGYPRGTVPALRLDGRRLQGSLEISRALDRKQPEPALFPADPAKRAAVEEAEAWGEADLQPVPRRVNRWHMGRSTEARAHYGKGAKMPAPGLAAKITGPLSRRFANVIGADEQQVRADVAAIPGLLDRVDELIAEGTIGGEQPNAADFQIVTSVRFIGAMPQFADEVARRPCGEWAQRLNPEFHREPLPIEFP